MNDTLSNSTQTTVPLGHLEIPLTHLTPLLASPQLLPHLLREWLITQAIAPLPPAPRPQQIQQFKLQRWGAQVESYFLKRKPQLDRVVYSLLRVADAGLAHELYFRLQAQEQTFAELAQQFSQGPEAHTHGIVGPVPLGTLPPPIAQRLAGAQPGQLFPPMPFQNSVWIIQLNHHLPAQFNSGLQQFLLDELFEGWLREQIAPHLPARSHPEIATAA
jgi:hypothetical protein